LILQDPSNTNYSSTGCVQLWWNRVEGAWLHNCWHVACLLQL